MRPHVAEPDREVLGGSPVQHGLYRFRALRAQRATVGIGHVLAVRPVDPGRDTVSELVIHQRTFVRNAHITAAPLGNVGDDPARLLKTRCLADVVDRPGEGGPAERGRLRPLDDFDALNIGEIDARNPVGDVYAVQEHRAHLLRRWVRIGVHPAETHPAAEAPRNLAALLVKMKAGGLERKILQAGKPAADQLFRRERGYGYGNVHQRFFAFPRRDDDFLQLRCLLRSGLRSRAPGNGAHGHGQGNR